MTVSGDVLRSHIEYTSWASQRLTEAAARLSSTELTRDFGTADKSVLGALVHVYAADRAWLNRVSGQPAAPFLDPERDMNLRVLTGDWPALLERWKTFLAGETHETAARALTYRDMKGRQWQTPLWQIVFHMVNHATHHRGQVSGFLRTMGHTPPPLDLIAYYRALSV